MSQFQGNKSCMIDYCDVTMIHFHFNITTTVISATLIFFQYRRLLDIDQGYQRLQCNIEIFPPSEAIFATVDNVVTFLFSSSISPLLVPGSVARSGGI